MSSCGWNRGGGAVLSNDDGEAVVMKCCFGVRKLKGCLFVCIHEEEVLEEGE
ncbi:unnamed protein product [Lathyrus sativus]|nr:unnamed protein product [Lathyrus sativus]